MAAHPPKAGWPRASQALISSSPVLISSPVLCVGRSSAAALARTGASWLLATGAPAMWRRWRRLTTSWRPSATSASAAGSSRPPSTSSSGRAGPRRTARGSSSRLWHRALSFSARGERRGKLQRQLPQSRRRCRAQRLQRHARRRRRGSASLRERRSRAKRGARGTLMAALPLRQRRFRRRHCPNPRAPPSGRRLPPRARRKCRPSISRQGMSDASGGRRSLNR